MDFKIAPENVLAVKMECDRIHLLPISGMGKIELYSGILKEQRNDDYLTLTECRLITALLIKKINTID